MVKEYAADHPALGAFVTLLQATAGERYVSTAAVAGNATIEGSSPTHRGSVKRR